MDRHADAPGEFLPAELAAEVRRLLASSPAVSPELSAWLLDHGFKKSRHQGGECQGQEAGASDGSVGPRPQSSPLPSHATDEQKNKGATWEAPHEWMSNVFGLLDADEAMHLGKARLVCSGWARHVMCIKTSLVVSMPKCRWNDNEQLQKNGEEFLRRLRDVSRVITKKQLPRVQALEIYIPAAPSRILIESTGPLLNSLMSTAFGGCQQLRTLKLRWYHTRPETISALRPLLPRLSCFHLMGSFDQRVCLTALEEALASMSSLTELQLDCTIEGFVLHRQIRKIPGRLLAALPKGLTRLSIRNVAFDDSSFGIFPCSETLTYLEIGESGSSQGPMGLSAAVNLKRLSILRDIACREEDLEDILTLSKLEHLGIDRTEARRARDDTMAHPWNTFVQRLPGCLPLLTSLELTNLKDCGEAMVATLGRLTGLTSLNLEIVPFYDVTDIIPLAPESLRHLAALTALRHLSLCGHAENHENPQFLESALPVLHCLPSLVSLDVGAADWILEACIPLFPVQLQTLVTDLSHDVDFNRVEENTAVLAALTERCPSLTSIVINEDYMGLICVEDLPRINEKLLPWLRVNATPARTPRWKDWSFVCFSTG